MKKLLLLAILLISAITFSQSCTHTLHMTDTYGDGWNGNRASVSVNGVIVVSNVTLGSGYGPATVTFTAAAGATIRVWRSTTGSWSYECQIRVTSSTGATVISLQTLQPGTPTSSGSIGTAQCGGGGGGGGTLVPYSGFNSINCGTNTTLYDHGGQFGSYSNYANGYTVLNNGGSAIISISGSTSGESCCDWIRIYQGIGTGGPIIGQYQMGSFIPTISSAPGLPLTVQFYSDVSVTGSGFALNVTYSGSCTTPLPPANPISISAGVMAMCSGGTTTLTANGAVGTVYWYTGGCGSTFIGTGNSIAVTPNVTTTYYARNYNNSQFSAGCAATTITVNPMPSVSITPSANPICAGNSTQLVSTVTGLPVGAPTTYTWTPNINLTNTSAPSPWASPTSTQSYTLTVSSNGCNASTSTTISVNPSLPQVSSISGNNNIIAGTAETYSITPIAGASYVWAYTQTVSAPLWVNIPNSNSPTTTFTWPQTTTNGAVRVTVSNAFGCNTQTQQYVIITMGALPVELLYFSGKIIDKSNLIYWATATEHNTTHFVVEKSENGVIWLELGTVAAAGNSTQELHYDVTDNAVKPIYNYYRLTQYDVDGAYETFDPIVINNKSSIRIVSRRTNLLGQVIDENATGIIIEVYENGEVIKTIK